MLRLSAVARRGAAAVLSPPLPPRAAAAAPREYAGIVDRLKSVVGLKPKEEAPAGGADISLDEPTLDLTLEAYANQLKRARQMSGLAAMLPAGASAALGGAEGTKALTAMLTQHEAIIRALTPEERAAPLATLSTAATQRIATEVGCAPRDVGTALGKYMSVRSASARLAKLKAEGKPMPTSLEEYQAALGGSLPKAPAAAAPAAAPAAPAGAAAGAGAAKGTGTTTTRMLRGRPVIESPQLPKAPDGQSRNGPCPCRSGLKYKRCCGK